MRTVRVGLLLSLARRPMRFTELAEKLNRPDKTIFVVTKELRKRGLIAKSADGQYTITETGNQFLEREEAKRRLEYQRFRPVVELVNLLAHLQTRHQRRFERAMETLESVLSGNSAVELCDGSAFIIIGSQAARGKDGQSSH